MITQYFQFDVKQDLLEKFSDTLVKDFYPLISSYKDHNYTEIWQYLDKDNSFLYTTKWFDESKREELLALPNMQNLFQKQMNTLESQIVQQKFEPVVLYDQPFEEEEIEFGTNEKNLLRRSIYVILDPNKEDLFLRLCKEHSPQFSKYGNRVKTKLMKNLEKDSEYFLNNYWQRSEDEVDYFNGNDFKLFWRVMNSLLLKSPTTIYAKRIFSSTSNNNL